MSGPCMCGDPYCRSCGPAQGNTRCHYCGAWSDDGGCADPEACETASKQTEYRQQFSVLLSMTTVSDRKIDTGTARNFLELLGESGFVEEVQKIEITDCNEAMKQRSNEATEDSTSMALTDKFLASELRSALLIDYGFMPLTCVGVVEYFIRNGRYVTMTYSDEKSITYTEGYATLGCANAVKRADGLEISVH
ncbi:MAG: hypothetical protein KIT88_10180 [Phycisphaeraceae bacterium]|nr:hypothetical protein [Phycisphaeraceae bacterium]